MTTQRRDAAQSRFKTTDQGSGVLSGYQQAVSKVDAAYITRNIKSYKQYGFPQDLSKLAGMTDTQRENAAANAVIAKFKDNKVPTPKPPPGGGGNNPPPGGGPRPKPKPRPQPKPQPRPHPKPKPKPKPNGHTGSGHKAPTPPNNNTGHGHKAPKPKPLPKPDTGGGVIKPPKGGGFTPS